MDNPTPPPADDGKRDDGLRGIDSRNRRAIERVTRDLITHHAAEGPQLQVRFVAANTRRDVAHGLGIVPTGYSIDLANANVHATDVHLWTPTVAYLISDTANSFAVCRFYTLREVPTDA